MARRAIGATALEGEPVSPRTLCGALFGKLRKDAKYITVTSYQAYLRYLALGTTLFGDQKA